MPAPNRKKSVFYVALGGVFGAMSMASLLMSSVFAVMDISLAGLAGLFLLPVVLECGYKYALCVCGVVSTLGLILCPNKEMPILFLCLLGYYPVLKIWLDKKFHRSRWLVLLRLLLANISIGIAYGTMIKILGLNYVVEEFANTGRGILVLLFVLTNMAIVVFDLAMEQLCVLYCNKISPKLHKTMWHS